MNKFLKHTESFERLFKSIKLDSANSDDRKTKIRQIISYLEVIDAQVRKISRRKRLVLIDCAAGNCYLSFLVYFYYTQIDIRDIEIHCIDHNSKLMSNTRAKAEVLGFSTMYFHIGDILDVEIDKDVDLLFSLHACDSATDKSLYLGLKLNARTILSVSCCQHTLARQFSGKLLRGMTRYKSFKSRLVYYVADTMRAHLLAMNGYQVDIFDFTSSRNTEKNIMIRANRNKNQKTEDYEAEYDYLRRSFKMKPVLEDLLAVNE